MYELPELDIVRALVAEKFAGAKITKIAMKDIEISSIDILEKELIGAVIWFVERRAQHLVFHLDSGKRLLVKLSKQAYFYTGDHEEESMRDDASFILKFGERFAAFYQLESDACQLLTVRQVEDQLNHIGPDALEKRFTLYYWKDQLSKKRSSIKTALLDDQLVVGIGPMYSDEILFQSGIKPDQKVNTLTDEQVQLVYQKIGEVLKNAVADGGSVNQPLYDQDTFTGSYKDKLNVYGRAGEPCHQCNDVIVVKSIAKNRSYFCPSCQGESL